MSPKQRVVEIREKEYPNSGGLYELRIARPHYGAYDGQYIVSEQRAKKIMSLIGYDNFVIELNGGVILLSAFPDSRWCTRGLLCRMST